MNEIILHGALRDQFGERFNMDVRDPLEAYRALACQLPGFRQEVRRNSFYLVREMDNGKFALTEDYLMLGMSDTRLHFIPSAEGSAPGNKGGVKLILGVAIIGASLFIPGGAMFAGMSLQTMGIMAGAALALGGLSLLLAPTPKLSTGDNEGKDSFLFSGNVNPSGQNIVVPIGFGTFRVPGIPVASRLETNQISTGDTTSPGKHSIF